MTTSVSTVADTMPPIIGTAMRCITSAPVPWFHMIGSRPAMMADCHHQRTHALTPAAHDCGMEIFVCERSAFGCALGLQVRERLVEIDQHHHAGLGGDACERDKSDRDGD